MKLKYYLRGLGIGIVVTVLLMGVSSSKEAKAETTQVAAVEKMTEETETAETTVEESNAAETATEFDAFLMQHGYDKKISVGVVEIPLNATWMEIAQKLSGSAE